MYARAQHLAPRMYATAQKCLRWSYILATVKFRAKAILQNVSVRVDMQSVDSPGGHPNSPTCGHFKFPHLSV